MRVFTSTFLIAAAVWGVVAAAISVFQFTESPVIALLVVVSALVVAGFASSLSLFTALNNIRSGYRTFRTPSIITRRKTHIHIDASFMARIHTFRDYVFFENPRPGDLVDMIDTLKGFELSPADYVSSDSYVVDHVAKKPHVMVLYWTPKKAIVPLVPYRHRTSNTSPSPYGPDFFYHSILFDRESGSVEVSVDAPLPFEQVFAFRMPRFKRTVSELTIYKWGMRSKRKSCAQPSVAADRKKVMWRFTRPIKGRMYVLFGLYEGELPEFLRKAEQQRWLSRARGRLSRISFAALS